MTKTNRGGAPIGNRNAAKAVTRKTFNRRFDHETFGKIRALVEAGYGKDQTEAVERAIDEAYHRWATSATADEAGESEE